jgi:hypothetical protein
VDQYHVWCDLRPGESDVAFCDDVASYLGALQQQGRIAGYRVSRRKLGLGPPSLGEFHIVIEVDGLAQLDRAFEAVSARSGPVESLHARVNQRVSGLTFALYRDFPDPHRVRGDEQF